MTSIFTNLIITFTHAIHRKLTFPTTRDLNKQCPHTNPHVLHALEPKIKMQLRPTKSDLHIVRNASNPKDNGVQFSQKILQPQPDKPTMSTTSKDIRGSVVIEPRFN